MSDAFKTDVCCFTLLRLSQLQTYTHTITTVFKGHTGTVFTGRLIGESPLAVTGGADTVLKLWDARTGSSVSSIATGSKEVSRDVSNALCVS
jgi:WD40 repeat protein